MAQLGAGWADGAWVISSWVPGAWDPATATPPVPVTGNVENRRKHFEGYAGFPHK